MTDPIAAETYDSHTSPPLVPEREPARLSCAVMAHPRRAAMVDELVAKLDRPATVVWDQRNDRWDTGRRSQLAYDPSATHHLVVQDDALIPHDFIAGVERAINYVPDGAAMSLYIGRVRPHSVRVTRAVNQADGGTASWIVMRDLHWGVGVVLPTRIIERLIRDQDAHRTIAEYDRRMSRWLVNRDIPVWYTWPSLVDHHPGPSLVAHGEGRRAHQFIGEDRSALDVDWSGPAVQVQTARDQGRTQWPRRVARRPVVVDRREEGET